jgi:hypothetical protein
MTAPATQNSAIPSKYMGSNSLAAPGSDLFAMGMLNQPEL